MKFDKKSLTGLIYNLREQIQSASLSDDQIKDLKGDITLSADNMILDDLPTLRQRSYGMYLNYPIATSIIDNITEFESNYKCVPTISDEKSNNIVKKYFKKFCKNVSISNETWNEFIELYKRSMLLSGEAYIVIHRVRRPESIFETTFNLIDPDRVFTPSDKKEKQYMIKDGIQFNELGVAEGFWVCKKIINDWEEFYFSNTQVRRNRNSESSIRYNYDSKEFDYYPFYNESGQLNSLHIYRKSRTNQTKGLPILTPVMSEIHKMHEYKNSEWFRLRIASCKGIFIQSEYPRENAINNRVDACDLVDTSSTFQYYDSSGELNTLDSTAYCHSPETDEYDALLDSIGDSAKVETLFPGQIIYGKPGETIQTISQDGQAQSVYADFIKNSIILISAAVKLPTFIMYPDWGAINYSSARAAINKYRNTLRDNQDFDIERLIDPLYDEFIFELYNKVEYLRSFDIEDIFEKQVFPPVVEHVDQDKEVTAVSKLIDMKLMSRTQYHAERGENLEDILKTISAEQELLKKYNISPISVNLKSETPVTEPTE